MARFTGVGLGAVIDGTAVLVTSFSFDEGEAAQVDVTAASDPNRAVVMGLQAPASGSISGIYEGTPPDVGACEGTSIWVFAKDESCDAVDILGSQSSEFPIYVTGYTVEASMDEVVTFTMNFVKREFPASEIP